jgi:hypothetical protein
MSCFPFLVHCSSPIVWWPVCNYQSLNGSSALCTCSELSMSCQCRSLPLSATSPLSLPSMANNFLPLSASSHVKHWTQMRNILTWVKELAWSIWNYMIQSLGNCKLSWVFRKSLVKATGQIICSPITHDHTNQTKLFWEQYRPWATLCDPDYWHHSVATTYAAA